MEEADDDKDDEDEGGGPTGAPLEYYEDFFDSNGVVLTAAIFLRNGDGGTGYGSVPQSTAGGGNGSRGN